MKSPTRGWTMKSIQNCGGMGVETLGYFVIEGFEM